MFEAFNEVLPAVLEMRVLQVADRLIELLDAQGVTTLGEALDFLLTLNLPSSSGDADLSAGALEKLGCLN